MLCSIISFSKMHLTVWYIIWGQAWNYIKRAQKVWPWTFYSIFLYCLQKENNPYNYGLLGLHIFIVLIIYNKETFSCLFIIQYIFSYNLLQSQFEHCIYPLYIFLSVLGLFISQPDTWLMKMHNCFFCSPEPQNPSVFQHGTGLHHLICHFPGLLLSCSMQ